MAKRNLETEFKAEYKEWIQAMPKKELDRFLNTIQVARDAWLEVFLKEYNTQSISVLEAYAFGKTVYDTQLDIAKQMVKYVETAIGENSVKREDMR